MPLETEKSSAKPYVVSAIVSTYNSERFMRGCLEDLTGQTLFEQGLLEIVVVDSASPQNEGAIVREFTERFGNSIVYIRTDTRETVYQAWNRGIQAASGRYITNANTDDRHRSDALEVMSGILDSDPAVDLVYADVLITRTSNETFEHNSATGRHNWFPWDRNTLLGVGCFIGPQPVWRRSLHDLYGGFDPSFVTSGDYEFWLRISQTSNFYYLEEPMGLYLKHDTSLEHLNEERKFSENRDILAQYRQAADEGKILKCMLLEQLRTIAVSETAGRIDSSCLQLFMKIDGWIAGKLSAADSLMSVYRDLEGRLLASELVSGQLIAQYIQSVETILLSGMEWYRTYQQSGTDGAVAGLIRDQLLNQALAEARKEARQGRTDKAVKVILNQAIRVHSASPLPYLELAEILIAAKRYEDALEALSEAPPETDSMIIWELSAVCHAALGEDDQAEREAGVLMLGRSDRPRTLEVLGTLAARQGNFEKARELFQRAFQADPERGEALLALGMLSWSGGDLEGAYHLLRRSVELSPLNGDSVKLLYDAAQRLGLVQDYIGLLQDLLTRMPDVRDIIAALADALAGEGNHVQAMKIVEQGLTLIGSDDILLDAALNLRQQLGPHTADLPEGAPSVSLCMIVKDEAVNLPRCLASVKPVVDDIVVVDTGSYDRTADIAVAFGARAFNFSWNGDFSAARNYSLSKAIGKWVLVMDADEVLSNLDYPLLEKAIHQTAQKQVAWSVTTRNYTNRVQSEGWHANDGAYPDQEQGDGWYPSRKVRLFPVSEQIRFRGEIHEMVEADLRAAGIVIEQADFVVHHYGELTDADRRVKQLRYYEMGRQKLMERPGDTISMAELALQAGELELFHEALELWDRLLANGVTTRDVYFNRSYVLMGLKRFSEASEMAYKAMEIDPQHKESAYNYGMCLMSLARPEQAVEKIAQESARHPDYPLLTALLCVLYLSTGEHESAAALLGNMRKRNYAIESYIRERVASLDQLGHMALAQRLREGAAGLGVVIN